MPTKPRSILRALSFTVLAAVSLTVAPSVAQDFRVPTPPINLSSAQTVFAQHGMVVAQEKLAADIGADILKRGGNAVDAAVATGFALAVVHPNAGNIGGGGFMLVRLKSGEVHFVDFRETAPARATERMYQDAQGNVVPNLRVLGGSLFLDLNA